MKKVVIFLLTAMLFTVGIAGDSLRGEHIAASDSIQNTPAILSNDRSILQPAIRENTTASEHTSAKNNPPEIFALFGVDAVDGERGRSDCILLASLDGSILRLCSIARDTLVQLPHINEQTKLAHAYAYGGPELALETIRWNFGIPVTRYASVNFSQMPELVELIGGVEVLLTEGEWHSLGLKEPYLGLHRLSGKEALCYCRLRSLDNDDQRTARQRTVVCAMVEAMQKTPSAKLPELAIQGLKLTDTNLTIRDIVRVGGYALAQRGEIQVDNLAIPGDRIPAWGGIRADNMWYYVYDLDLAREVLTAFFYPNNSPAE